MKKFMVAMTMFIITSSASAQNVKEPEYNGQVAVLQEDSSLVVLQKEVAQMKTKTSGFGYIPIGVFQFESKKKERRFQLAEVGVLSGMKATTSFNTVDYEVKKWGASSYIVAIKHLQPGEYGVTTADLGNITTLSVK